MHKQNITAKIKNQEARDLLEKSIPRQASYDKVWCKDG